MIHGELLKVILYSEMKQAKAEKDKGKRTNKVTPSISGSAVAPVFQTGLEPGKGH
jgi:hypothetical protein